ncbi:MAG: SusC/RagA family TonB-linked outer membrane protein [Bacteroidales bacterium]|nr:SusC/RagA family TonB-linked outer membrane protein [Bacteroidales bacterium]
MKKTLFTLFSVLFILLAQSAGAQNVKVSGTVTDAIGPVVGATVMVHGTTNGAVTDLNGAYTLSVPANAVLDVACMGYKSISEPLNGRAVVNFVLTEDSQLLEDAIVLGYGAATKKKDLSAAVGVVATPERLAQIPAGTTALLQGQIPGVTVQSDGGGPGGGNVNMVIRGQGSRNGDSVLWVVDGVPGGPINSVSDIESIVVLKDAASAAIYGAQSGAGGVILVTTKKGTKGVNVSYDGLIGTRTCTNLLQPLTAQEQIELRKQTYANAGLPLPDGWDTSINPWVGENRTNWMDEVFRSGIYHRHNIVLNAGGDNYKTRLSLAVSNSDGVVVNTFSNGVGLNFRGEYDINKWIKVTEDFRWGTGKSKGANTSSDQSGVILMAVNMPSSAVVRYDDGTWGGTTTEDPEYIAQYGSNFASIHSDCINPVHQLYRDNPYNVSSNVMSTTGLEFANLVKGLKFNSRFTYYLNTGFSRNFSTMRPEIGKPEISNSLSYSASVGTGWKTENTLNYDNTFGKHSVGALLSTTANYDYGRGFSASGKTFADESEALSYFNYATEFPNPSDYLSGPDANYAFIGRLSYSFNDRYFFTASWRRDVAGRLPDGHNYGDFPAVTGAWKISSEPFFPKTSAVTLLKIRSSFGRVGNLGSIGWNYKSNTLSSGGWNNQQAQYGLEKGDGHVGTFYFMNKALNPNLTWETSQQFDLGLDAAFLKDRLEFTADFYNKRTFNLIQGQTSGWPDSIGMSAMLINQGEIMNRGIELMAGWNDKIGDWSYFVNGNAAYNKNWVSDIGVLNSDGTKGVWTGGGSWGSVPSYTHQTKEGEPLNSFYMIKCLGIFQSEEDVYAHNKDGKLIQPNAVPGDLIFEDYNDDGKIDDKDRQYFGNATPDWTYALNFGFSYKNFTFSAMLQGVLGAQTANMGKNQLYNENDVPCNREIRIFDCWSPDNRHTDLPRLTMFDNNSNWSTPSTFYLEDASYLRLKNIIVSYDFTNLIRRANHFNSRNSSCSIYFSGENIFTITRYSGMDPECGDLDGLKYPVSRILSLGIKLTY